MDLGGNYPTTIPNVYLFYRKGYSGVCIEHNPELAKLYRWFRRCEKLVDLERLNYQIIHGSSKTLVISNLLCIDVDDTENKALITQRLKTQNEFKRIKKLGCNILLINKLVAGKLKSVA